MATARTGTAQAQQLLFTLDGVVCGFVAAAAGGGIVGDVAEVKEGTGGVRKLIDKVGYEPLTVDVGLGVAHDVFDWIGATWSGAFPRKDCSITGVDATLNARWQQQCRNTLLTGVAFGAFDAASKDAMRLSLTIAPQVVQDAPASGKASFSATGKSQPLLASHFRLELAGVDCTGVRRIEPFAVQVDVTQDVIGAGRDPQLVPARVVFPNLGVTFSDNPAAASWRTWANDFLVNGDHAEKDGAIVFLAPDLKSELGRVTLHGVGICGLRRETPAFAAELYCQAMTLQVGAPTPLPPPPLRKPTPVPARPVTPAG